MKAVKAEAKDLKHPFSLISRRPPLNSSATEPAPPCTTANKPQMPIEFPPSGHRHDAGGAFDVVMWLVSILYVAAIGQTLSDNGREGGRIGSGKLHRQIGHSRTVTEHNTRSSPRDERGKKMGACPRVLPVLV